MNVANDMKLPFLVHYSREKFEHFYSCKLLWISHFTRVILKAIFSHGASSFSITDWLIWAVYSVSSFVHPIYWGRDWSSLMCMWKRPEKTLLSISEKLFHFRESKIARYWQVSGCPFHHARTTFWRKKTNEELFLIRFERMWSAKVSSFIIDSKCELLKDLFVLVLTPIIIGLP